MSGTSTAAWLKRIAVVLIGPALAWRIVSLGMAGFYADRMGENPAAAAAALAWYPQHPDALRGRAAQLEGSDPAQAESLLIRAYRGDPTDGHVLIRLAGLWRRQGQTERADTACALAERLFPADVRLHLQAAQYWLGAGNLQRTLQNWDLAMQINPATALPLFPVLLNVSKDPAGLAMLGRIAATVPPWWQSFFAYATQNAAQMDTLRALYSLRKAAGQPLGLAEVNTYLARLMREGLWAEAYMIWINALPPEQQQVLGYLFDGGFEATGFQGTFDWSATTAKNVQVTANYTQLVTGKKALHIVLGGRTLPASIVEQTVFLLPGRYRFSGRVRPDAIQASAGLEWALDCVSGSAARLASSERFLGSDMWRKFSVDFQVSSGVCAGVRLRLQPVGYQTEDRETKGEIWFDDLVVELLDGAVSEVPRDAPPEQKKPPRTGGDPQAADTGVPPPRKAVTKPPAKNGQGNASGMPGTPDRKPKAVPQGGRAESGDTPPTAR